MTNNGNGIDGIPQEPTVDDELLARYLAGECSAPEKEEIRQWLAVDTENRYTADFLQAVWDTPPIQTPPSDVAELWREVASRTGISAEGERVDETSRRFFALPHFSRVRVLKYAAVLLLVMLLALIVNFVGIPFITAPAPAPEWQTAAVGNGDTLALTLDDGTRVTLDAGSRLRYPAVFKGLERRVFLNGEGFFRVAPNKEKPFTVHAGHAVITVVGTEFNVTAWQGTREIRVAVKTGKVSLHKIDDAARAVVIAGGESSVLPANGSPTTPRPVDVAGLLGWMNRDMVFQNVPLREILERLERWHDIRFLPDDDIALSDHLTLHVRSGPLQDTLELIAALMDVDYKRQGPVVYLKSRKR